jgi:hypothetical protein
MEGMITACVEGEPYDGVSDSSKKNFAIWSKTFELDDLAIALYLVEVDQMVAKGVRAMYPASTTSE